MYSCQSNCQCGQAQSNCGSSCNMGMTGQQGRLNPIVMPTQVCARQCFSFVEQPVIQPIEYRSYNNVVAVPRYYQTRFYTGFANNGNAGMMNTGMMNTGMMNSSMQANASAVAGTNAAAANATSAFGNASCNCQCSR